MASLAPAHAPANDNDAAAHACCVAGALDAGTPAGSVQRLGGVDVYVATAPSCPREAAVVLLTDVFGWALPNVRLLADSLATQGLTTYIPDLHAGDSLRADAIPVDPPASLLARLGQGLTLLGSLPSIIPWLRRHGDAAALPRLGAALRALKEHAGVERVVPCGFCWGGRYAILLSHRGGGGPLGVPDDALLPRVAAIVAAHPSSVAVPGDLTAMQAPGLFLCAESDGMFPPRAVALAGRELARVGGGSRVVVYPGTAHGFVVRGGAAVPAIVAARREAVTAMAEFCAVQLGLRAGGGGSGPPAAPPAPSVAPAAE